MQLLSNNCVKGYSAEYSRIFLISHSLILEFKPKTPTKIFKQKLKKARHGYKEDHIKNLLPLDFTGIVLLLYIVVRSQCTVGPILLT